MTIVVTGAAGQLGREMCRLLDVRKPLGVNSNELDITDFDAVSQSLRAAKASLVINCAAYTQVDVAEEDAEEAFRVNALGPRNLAIATHELGVPLVQVSTDYVFDGTAGRPYHEYDTPCPASVYGASKLAGEQAVATLNPRHYIARTAWLYDDDGGNFPNTMLNLADRDEVRVVHDQHGSPTYVPHLAVAIAALMESGAYGVWHLAGSGEATWYELTRTLYAALDIVTPVVPVTTEEFPRPAARPAYSVLHSMQSPRIKLPEWQVGLEEFARKKRARAASNAA
ncbi:MAG: dTDP-4-dehydrorhamnose reductase [Gammaproteobacteria bacterium]|nr:dTDP-4-dehydrorhamnose reductase [Gammaproteobacteria bacterium]